MILNLAAYHFVAISDPDALARQLRDRFEAASLRGTALVTPEGINLFLAGEPESLRAVVAWMRIDARFADLIVKWSESEHVPFKRLRVKRKREIITFRKDGLDPVGARAAAVDPPTLRRWLEQGRDDAGRALVMVDTRNAQEIDYGTFEGALTFPIAKFTELPEALERHREALRDKTLVSFCTGGIRCEKAAIWMQQAGYEHVLQLDGGILGYFEQVGGYGYRDRCFVFDERVALDPHLTPLRDEPVAGARGPASSA
ncbi:MAG TPA: sulfurtransferase [Patescibacteria group bacterium]|nr:sulfurtransferase [Patescibacteria group bacterium]